MKPLSQILRAKSRVAFVMLGVLFSFIASSYVPALVAGAVEKGARARITDSILGVRIGSTLEEVHRKLKPLGTFGGRDTRDGGRKEAWTLKGTEFNAIAYQTNREGRVMWVTGFVRPGKEIPFSKLGDLATATGKSQVQAFWNMETDEGSIRLIVKGAQSKARVIHLLSLSAED